MDAGASPIGAQSSSSARRGRIRYRAELELRAPDGSRQRGGGKCSRASCAKQILSPRRGEAWTISGDSHALWCGIASWGLRSGVRPGFADFRAAIFSRFQDERIIRGGIAVKAPAVIVLEAP